MKTYPVGTLVRLVTPTEANLKAGFKAGDILMINMECQQPMGIRQPDGRISVFHTDNVELAKPDDLERVEKRPT